MLIKTCIKCNNTKELNDFYVHSAMKGGRLNKCKECAKQDSLKNRAENKEYYKEYDRKRANDPKRIQKRKEYANSIRGKERVAAGRKNWISRNPEKTTAHNALARAVRDKKVLKPDYCFVCGEKAREIHGHHFDYNKPLEVLWCCADCHIGLHKMLRERGRLE